MLRTLGVWIALGLSVLANGATAVEAARSWETEVATADLNRDGALSPHEISQAPKSAGAGLKPLMGRHYKTMDRNGDGQLAVAEIQAWQRQHGVSDAALSGAIKNRPMTGSLDGTQ